MTAPGGDQFLRVTLTVEGDIVVDRLLKGIEERASAPFPGAAPGVVAAFQRIVARAFETEGGSTDAGAWPELAEKTQRERRRLGYGADHPILQRTGALQRALTLGEGVDVRTTPTSLQYVLPDEPASVASFTYHQSTAPRRKLPRRAMVSLTGDDRNELMRPIRLYITGRDPNAPMREPIP